MIVRLHKVVCLNCLQIADKGHSCEKVEREISITYKGEETDVILFVCTAEPEDEPEL